MLIEALSDVGRGGPRKAGAVAAFHAMCRQRELADRQDGTADGGERQVHLAGLVAEDAQGGNLAGELFGPLLRVARHGTDENEKATADGAGDLGLDRDGSFRNPLDDGAQGPERQPSKDLRSSERPTRISPGVPSRPFSLPSMM